MATTSSLRNGGLWESVLNLIYICPCALVISVSSSLNDCICYLSQGPGLVPLLIPLLYWCTRFYMLSLPGELWAEIAGPLTLPLHAGPYAPDDDEPTGLLSVTFT